MRIRLHKDGPTKSCDNQKYIVRLLKSTLKLVPLKICHFRVAFYLCFKTCLGAQPFMKKWAWFARQWTCNKNSFPHDNERLCTAKTRFETEVTATRKWLIVKTNFKLKVHIGLYNTLQLKSVDHNILNGGFWNSLRVQSRMKAPRHNTHPVIFTCLHHKQVFRWWPFDRMIFLAVLKFSVTSDQEALQIELLVYRLGNKKTDAFHCWEKFICFQWCISVEWHNSVGHSTLYTDDD